MHRSDEEARVVADDKLSDDLQRLLAMLEKPLQTLDPLENTMTFTPGRNGSNTQKSKATAGSASDKNTPALSEAADPNFCPTHGKACMGRQAYK